MKDTNNITKEISKENNNNIVTVKKYNEWLVKFNGRNTYITKSLFSQENREKWSREVGSHITAGARLEQEKYWSQQLPLVDFAENLIEEMLWFEDLYKKYKKDYWKHLEEIEQLKEKSKKDVLSIEEQILKIGKLNNHKKIVSEIAKEYYEPSEDAPNQHEKLIEELEKGEKSDAIINIIRYWKSEAEKWEEEAMIHLDAIGVSEVWNKRAKKELRDEIDNGLELIEEADEVIKSQQEQITKLNEFYLANKPLPKTPNKFKIFKEKVKTKFQQFKQLATKKKTQKVELIAQIEVKAN